MQKRLIGGADAARPTETRGLAHERYSCGDLGHTRDHVAIAQRRLRSTPSTDPC